MTKIIKIRSTNPVEGYTIIDGKDIKLLQDDCESRQKDIKAIIDNKDSTRPKNYDEIRKEKCLKAKECDECKKGICSCTYVNASNRKETIMCTEAEKGANF